MYTMEDKPQIVFFQTDTETVEYGLVRILLPHLRLCSCSPPRHLRILSDGVLGRKEEWRGAGEKLD